MGITLSSYIMIHNLSYLLESQDLKADSQQFLSNIAIVIDVTSPGTARSGRGSYSLQLQKLLRPHHRLVSDLMRVLSLRISGHAISIPITIQIEVHELVLIFWSGQGFKLNHAINNLLLLSFAQRSKDTGMYNK